MLRLDFAEQLTAFEIREPSIEVCKEVAVNFDLHVTFHQPQQPVFTGTSFGRRSQRERIGNGKHKNWHVDFQEEESSCNRPTVVGRIILKAPFEPDNMLFGGFAYGKFGEEKPIYPFITVHTPTELNHYRPIDPSPDILDMTYQGLKDVFEGSTPRLFEVSHLSSASEYRAS